MKSINFHPLETKTRGQIKAKQEFAELVVKAASKGLKLTGTSFGVGFFIFYPDGKRVRFTSFSKLVEFINTYTAPVAA